MHLYDGGGKRLWERPGKDGRRNSTGASCGGKNRGGQRRGDRDPGWKRGGAGAAGETGAGDGPLRGKDAPVQTEPLLVYLNDFDGVIGDLFKEATGYDVEVVAGNGAETMSRIEAEKSNPQWDVVWIDSMYDVYNLSGDGSLLTGWEPENAANLTEFSKGTGAGQ